MAFERKSADYLRQLSLRDVFLEHPAYVSKPPLESLGQNSYPASLSKLVLVASLHNATIEPLFEEIQRSNL